MSEKEVAFARDKHIQLSNGDEIDLPRLTLSKILAISSGIAELAKAAKEDAPDLFSDIDLEKNPQSLGFKIVQSIPVLFPILSDKIISVLASYLDKDREWIEENLDLEDIAKIATPLFAILLAQGNSLVKAVNEAFQQGQKVQKK